MFSFITTNFHTLRPADVDRRARHEPSVESCEGQGRLGPEREGDESGESGDAGGKMGAHEVVA